MVSSTSIHQVSNVSLALKVWTDDTTHNLVFLSKSNQKYDVRYSDNSGVRFLSSSPYKDRQTTDVDVTHIPTAFSLLSTKPGRIRVDAFGDGVHDAPHSLELVPTERMHLCHDSSCDFRVAILQRLTDSHIGSTLYDVRDHRDVLVGHLVMAGLPRCSLYGDRQLHFHHDMEFDREFPPISREIQQRLQQFGVLTSIDDNIEWLYTFYWEIPGLRWALFPSSQWILLKQIASTLWAILEANGWYLLKPAVPLLVLMALLVDLLGILPCVASIQMLPLPMVHSMLGTTPEMCTIIGHSIRKSLPDGVRRNPNLFQSLSPTSSLVVLALLGILSRVAKPIESRFIDLAMGREINVALSTDVERLGTYPHGVRWALQQVVLGTILFNYFIARTLGSLVRYVPLQSFLRGFRSVCQDRDGDSYARTIHRDFLRDVHGLVGCPLRDDVRSCPYTTRPVGMIG
jgi:hypothetical protein